MLINSYKVKKCNNQYPCYWLSEFLWVEICHLKLNWLSKLSLVIYSLVRLKEEIMARYMFDGSFGKTGMSGKGQISKFCKLKALFKRYVQCAHKKANFLQCVYT